MPARRNLRNVPNRTMSAAPTSAAAAAAAPERRSPSPVSASSSHLATGTKTEVETSRDASQASNFSPKSETALEKKFRQLGIAIRMNERCLIALTQQLKMVEDEDNHADIQFNIRETMQTMVQNKKEHATLQSTLGEALLQQAGIMQKIKQGETLVSSDDAAALTQLADEEKKE